MSYTVSASRKSGIRLNEPDRVESILQNIAVILMTRQGDVPLFREFGLPMKFVDRPMNAAAPAMIVEIREAIQRFEPRAELVSVKFNQDAHGILSPEVEVNIIDE
jgi:hypothetical protein